MARGSYRMLECRGQLSTSISTFYFGPGAGGGGVLGAWKGKGEGVKGKLN